MMKRLLFCICTLLCVQIVSAQIITSKSALTREVPKNSLEKNPIEKGYRGFVEVAYTLSTTEYESYEGSDGTDWSDSYSFSTGHGFDILTTHGYQFNNWVFVGAGVGLIGSGVHAFYVENFHVNGYSSKSYSTNKDGNRCGYVYYPDRNGLMRDGTFSVEGEEGEFCYNTVVFSLPIYANMRIYMTQTKVKPFFDAKIGGLLSFRPKEVGYIKEVCNDKSCNDHYEFYHKERKSSGVYFQCGLGVEYKFLALSVNYSLKGYKEMENYRHYYDYTSQNRVDSGLDYGVFTFNLGYNF